MAGQRTRAQQSAPGTPVSVLGADVQDSNTVRNATHSSFWGADVQDITTAVWGADVQDITTAVYGAQTFRTSPQQFGAQTFRTSPQQFGTETLRTCIQQLGAATDIQQQHGTFPHCCEKVSLEIAYLLLGFLCWRWGGLQCALLTAGASRCQTAPRGLSSSITVSGLIVILNVC